MVMLALVFIAWGLLVPAAHLAVFVAPLVLLMGALRNGGLRTRDVLRTITILAVAAVVLVFFYDLPIWHRVTQFRYQRACRSDSSFDIPATPVTAHGLKIVYEVDPHGTSLPDGVANLAKDPLLHLSSGPYQGFGFVEREAGRYAGRREDHTIVQFDVNQADVALEIHAPAGKALGRFEIRVMDRRTNRRVAQLQGYSYHGESCPNRHDVKHFLASSVVPIQSPAEPLIPVRRELRAIKVSPDHMPPPTEKTTGSISGPFESCPTLYRTFERHHSRIEFVHGHGSRRILIHDAQGRSQEVADAACGSGLVYVLLRDRHDSRSRALLLHIYDAQGNLIEQSTVSFEDFSPLELKELFGAMMVPLYTRVDQGRVTFSLYERVNRNDRARSVQFEHRARLAIVPYGESMD